MTTTTFNRATFANICKAYGFVEKYNCLYWGRGSLVWGREAYVKYCGDAVEIEFHKWQYNCDMDAEFDDTEVVRLGVADAIGYLATVCLW